MKLIHKYQIILAAVLVAWVFDQLFWKKAPGISLLLFVLVYLSGLIIITKREKLSPPKHSWWMVFPPLLFSILFFLRLEPFTTFVNFLLVMTSLAILTMSWLGGTWYQYSLSDFIVRAVKMLGLGAFSPIRIFLPENNPAAPLVGEPQGESAPNRQPVRRWIGSVLLGLVLALPALLILGILLSSADPIFNNQLILFFNYFSIENFQDFFMQTIIILVMGYAILSAYLFSLLHSQDKTLINQGKPWLPPFLNWITSSIVLTSINILFLTFVVVQFRYFFGGQENISYGGFTFAEYARQGFGELIFVAFISMVIFLGLGMITKRLDGWKSRIVSILGILLVLLVGVILVSAFQRLLLYEAAYGFSRLRAYTTIFLIWQGILLLLIVGLELFNRLRHFVIVVLIVFCGFGLTLSVLNVDGFITRQNVANALSGHPLDQTYLFSLSDDATPDFFNFFHDPSLPKNIHNQIGAVLICRTQTNQPGSRSVYWPSFNLAQYQSQLLYAQFGKELEPNTLYRENDAWHVIYNGLDLPCDKIFTGM